MNLKPLHFSTPLVESRALSKLLGKPVYLKMESTQPTGSFKIRGIGFICQFAYRSGASHVVSSSGGNAGLATAYAANRLGMRATIVVPQGTSEFMLERIRNEGAQVVVHGAGWDEAHQEALKIVEREKAFYVHPFDHPVVWEGHAPMIEEVAQAGVKPGMVVTSVGGGGLMCGILEGMHRVGWTDIPVLAVETEGTASFAAAMRAKELVTLEKFSGIAHSLGARTVAQGALDWLPKHPIRSWVCSDKMALNACLSFADDHRTLVEPACGAALASVYEKSPELSEASSVLVIVCGGAAVSLARLQEWKNQIGF